MTRLCDTCNLAWPEDRFNSLCTAPNTCFRCRASSTAMAYLKYPQGRKEFHGATIKERQERTLQEFEHYGTPRDQVVPKWHKTYSGGVGSAFGGDSNKAYTEAARAEASKAV